MVSKKVIVPNSIGLHARPAAVLVKMAKEYQCSVLLYNGEKSANINSIISLLTLGAKQGTQLNVVCDGEGEDVALEQVVALLETMVD